MKKDRWYSEVTRYEWLVLIIASAGWMFDVFEGQLFNITRNQLLADILKVPLDAPEIRNYGDQFLGIFLLGGTIGGLFFGSLADRWGRRPTMVVTIAMYSVFSGLTFFAETLWQVAALRFLVAMGVGGEWAVAAALVAEVFSAKARAHAASIFHASSIFGTWLAALAGMAVGGNWRYAYLFGIVPALLILWVRASLREPEMWSKAESQASGAGKEKLGSYRELLLDPRWRGRALGGMMLATIGLGTFWSVNVAGQDLAKDMLIRQGVEQKTAIEKAKFAYGIVETAGAGLGLLAFGPLCVWLGRKRAFALVQIGALVIIPVTCYLPQTYGQLLILLPVFGFFTLSMHAGFAVYFPELFPTRLRGTGAGFCFNAGRILAASMLWFSGRLKAIEGMDIRLAITILGSAFLLGLIIVLFLPETKGRPLPE
ncbi:MAG: putative sialic acid transporter [candidate division BRC1 bacterium ADurb.BinA364]|nr:MAG: putative sialic acid transporter [candidate division BRC1 bacterium ADurb.BinA364]